MHFTSEPTPEQLSNLSSGAKLASLEPEMTDFIEKSMWQTQQRMFSAIATNTFTPEMAVQGWHELNAAFRMLQKYKQSIKVGRSVGVELTKGE
jgi:hypothetical protein